MRPILRPVREADLDALSRSETERASSPYDDFGFTGAGSLRKRFAEDGFLPAGGERGRLAVVLGDGDLAGTASWHTAAYGPNAGSRAFNLGIVLFPEHRGQGLGVSAMRALVRYLFEQFEVGRLEGSTDVENLAMQRVAERVGFQREGILRGAQFRLGKRHDLVLYSMLRDDLAPETTG
ncbi:MAG: GNAT family N-acetyltransferase [Myxococcales bacterium]|nr:GNAT family N-acetyltransferase [Myxococcales bacterium]